MKQSIILSKSESMIFLRDSPFELDDIEYRRNIFRKNKERVIDKDTNINIATTWKSNKSSKENDDVIDRIPRDEKIVVNERTS